MPTSILLLSDLSYRLGIIGLAEMLERADIVRWLSEDDAAVRDPRGANDIESCHEQSVRDEEVFVHVPGMPPSGEGTGERKQAKREPPIIHFLALKRWYFTIGDPDCVPAVPHGHENAKTQKWPKLNPYTGRVFSDVHVEDVSRRLTRADMKALSESEICGTLPTAGRVVCRSVSTLRFSARAAWNPSFPKMVMMNERSL